MKIENNKVVSFHYRVSEATEGTLEDTYGAEPVTYLHGHEQMLKGLEDALQGKQTGDKVEVTLAPKDAYGEHHEAGVVRVPISHVLAQGKAKARFKPGMIVHINTPQGQQPVRVVKVGLKNLDVDMNHPYAGKTLTFAIEVLDVREATAEEIDHGHVHGEGGVHH